MTSRMRAFIAVGVAAAAALAIFLWHRGPSAPPPQTEKRVWNYSVWGPPRAFTSGLEYLSRTLAERSHGRYELKISFGGALSPEKENLDALKLGAVDGAHVCFSYFPAKVPLARVLELAFLLTDDMRVNARVQEAFLLHPLIEKDLAEHWNTKYLALVVLPNFEFMSHRRIASFDDFRGLRVRVLGGYPPVFQGAGAVPVMVTAPEVYTAMERGTMDAVAFPWTDSMGTYRIHEVARFGTDGVRIPAVTCFSGITLDAWNAIPEDIKADMPRIRQEVMETYFRAYEEADRKWLPIFRQRVEIVPFSKAERDKLVKLAEPTWSEWAAEMDAKGQPGTELLEFVKQQVARFSAERR